ncbi:hypothetical protein [Dehalogenimonas alkenigignens]|uniref:hypothetical protein n=1 Tax=Dehalogenimonas alkenigignens TaxID=1217799 RepID=UPI000D574941|nr:hypothetical protein [Dehalogenimonas alkenigignens]PVV82557.1 hypothetical protein DD509_08445 [Dehalogenimonas alkenigignens]
MNAKKVNCIICGSPITVRAAKGRHSNKPFIMLVCPNDGRHFRAFISDQSYLKKVLAEVGGGTRGTGSDLPAADIHNNNTNQEPKP